MNWSLCMVVKDEGSTIRRAVESCLPVVDEVVILIDEATTDDTWDEVKAALDSFPGRKVLSPYRWENDFSKARNLALEKCQGDYVFILDGHEWLDSNGYSKLLGVKDYPQGFDVFQLTLNVCDNPEGRVTHTVTQERVFRSDIRYENAVHNQIRIPEGARVAVLTGVDLYHQQIATASDRARQRTAMNLPDLLHRWETERDAKLLPVIGKTFMAEGDLESAIKYFQMYLEDADPSDVNGLYHTRLKMSKALLDLKRYNDAIITLIGCEQLKSPRNEHLTFLADIFLGLGDWFRAIYYATLASNIPEPHGVPLLFIGSYREAPWEIMRRSYEKLGYEKGVRECLNILESLERKTA